MRLPCRQSLSPAFHLPIFLSNAPHCAICARSTCSAQTRALWGVQHARSVRLPSRARSTCSAQTIAPRAHRGVQHERSVRLPSNPPIQQALHRAQSCALRTPSTRSTLAAALALRALRLPIFQSNAPHRARSLGTINVPSQQSRHARSLLSNLPIFRSNAPHRAIRARSTCLTQTIAPRALRGGTINVPSASSRATRAHCSPIFRSSDLPIKCASPRSLRSLAGGLHPRARAPSIHHWLRFPTIQARFPRASGRSSLFGGLPPVVGCRVPRGSPGPVPARPVPE
jgi:hypothetical protein